MLRKVWQEGFGLWGQNRKHQNRLSCALFQDNFVGFRVVLFNLQKVQARWDSLEIKLVFDGSGCRLIDHFS